MSDARKVADTDLEEASSSEGKDKPENRRASDRIIIGAGEIAFFD